MIVRQTSRILSRQGTIYRQPKQAEVIISSQQLFGDARELQIEHNGEIYRLRVTRQEKLILTK